MTNKNYNNALKSFWGVSPRLLAKTPALGEGWEEVNTSHIFSAIRGGQRLDVVKCYKHSNVKAGKVWSLGQQGFVALNLTSYTDRFGGVRDAEGSETSEAKEVL